MNWYYAQGDQQLGPITQTDFDNLVRNGIITPDTRVWREGMADWLPYSSISAGGATQTAVPPAGSVVCVECKKIFPASETIRFGTDHVCAACKPYYVQRIREGAVLPGMMDYAGFWTRLGAIMLDGIILSIPFFIIMFIYGYTASRRTEPGAVNFGMQGLVQLGFFGLSLIYKTFFLGRYGATPGKMAAKIRVVTADGEKISYGRAFGRSCAEFISGIICYIGYIMAAFDPEKKALHDRICNTRVIKNPRR